MPPATLRRGTRLGKYHLEKRLGAGSFATVWQARDTVLAAFSPHMHLRGKAFRFDAILPDGTRTTLLDVPKWDFNWQLTYQLREPLVLPAGTRIQTTAWFDNSADNPANPDPKRIVPWGDQTYDEMMLGYIEWHPLK